MEKSSQTPNSSVFAFTSRFWTTFASHYGLKLLKQAQTRFLPVEPVGETWVEQFLKRYPEYQKKLQLSQDILRYQVHQQDIIDL
jgi:hypothetical protein